MAGHGSTVRAGIRWFAAEFVVVVAGVLAALALQAWYQARQDAAAEGEYLSQLEADLAASRQMIVRAIAEDSARVDANARLLAALQRGSPPPADSARQWLRLRLGFYSDPRPVLGTVNTLIETGDIRLIRDAVLRSRIVAYASQMAMDAEELSRNVTRLIGANDAERTQWERNGLAPLELDPGEALGVEGMVSDQDAARFQQVYRRAWGALSADADLRAAIGVRRTAFTSRLFYLQRMAATTDELRRSVEQARDPTPSP